MDAEEIVRAELDADPLGRGYSGMSDAEANDSLNAVDRMSWLSVSAADVLEAIVPAHWAALTAADRANVDSVLSMGRLIDLSPGANARLWLTTSFAGKTATLDAIEAAGQVLISRAAEIGCSCNEEIVTAARAL